MDILETIRTRRSVRAFRDEPVPKATLESLLRDASRAPSAINMQPWEVHMVLDDERKRLSRKLVRSYRERGLGCAPGSAKPLPELFMDRGRECADGMTPLIRRMDREFSDFINEGSLDFYGAPAVALLFMDDAFSADRVVDIGSFAAYLVLAAAGHGLGSCPIGLVRAYEEEVKDQLNIEESKHLILSVALGYPEPEAPVNEFRSPRADLREFVRWID
jgi:nitroreductase